ncbi:MAG: SUMF1/EgtB/PvdO family nonheme iron enzyme [Deltaproteobacteria bacterium]|nr:SUMF1/EgtB/PvdO family nonheme iron enzyme [Deltaproteobacteria bacterium]MCB9787567.1 SUMF1/EgtB/PvdO family nonheme iron enzyme [Deltaproteobacteria bacterium]
MVAAATTVPTVKITAPALFEQITYAGAGTHIVMSVTVANATIGGGASDLRIRYFLDGVLKSEAQDTTPYDFLSLPLGQHHLAARLVTALGEPLPNASSLAAVYVRIIKPCGSVSDCDDGMSCSSQACVTGQCRYGVEAGGCCDNVLECPYGWDCIGGSCVECQTAADCDDGNNCTVDGCSAANTCVHTEIAECCNAITNTKCGDGDSCTLDSCNLATETCEHAVVADPLCCNERADCKPADPCFAYICYVNTNAAYPRCRIGPSQYACCDEDSDCTAKNSCQTAHCEFASVDDEAGTCVYEQDPTKPDCCVTKADCDDGDPSTIDACTANACTHDPDPDYCALPATGSVVINEFMPAPGAVPDAQGEWIELYNTTSKFLDITGWTLETSLGEVHVIIPANAKAGTTDLTLLPRGYLVMGRSTDSTVNGGTKSIRYTYGNTISLPDAYEALAPVMHTLTLKNAAGEIVDEVTYRHCFEATCEDGDGDPLTLDDSVCIDGEPCTTPADCDTGFCDEDHPSWAILVKHSVELRNPFLDNSVTANWNASGTSPNPALNLSYGGKGSTQIFATPAAQNRSSYADIAVTPDVCPPPPDLDNPCLAAFCSLDNRCAYKAIYGCCEQDTQCDAKSFTFNVCEVSTCVYDPEDPVVGSCGESETVPGCCVRNEDCDDGNVCNLDRCIANVCRHSGDIIQDCCQDNEECEDGDACTVNTCDGQEHQCNPPEPVTLQGTGTCCNTAADCNDDDVTTLDLCSEENVCTHDPDPDYCVSELAPCDDENDCTIDSCDVASERCVHDPNPACCIDDSECNDDNLCTTDSCTLETGECVNAAIPECCNSAADCDDDDGCTVDTCGADNICVHEGTPLCCNTDADCPPAKYCNLDDCVGHSGVCMSAVGGLQDCCATAADCDDSKPYTNDVCDPTAKTCSNPKNPDWCLSNSDCTDGIVCTDDICDPSTGICTSTVNPACCDSDDDCAPDGIACTDEICDVLTGQCSSEPVLDCCEDLGINPLCDDGDPCTTDVCDLDHVCRPQEAPGCCQFDWECADELECTTDSCVIPIPGQPGSCQNVQETPGCCCPDGFECQPDGSCQNDLEVALPGGTAWVGCNPAIDDECAPNESPYHQIILKAYAIDKTEVTAAAYKECVTEGTCTRPQETSTFYATYDDPAKQDHPVNYVTWEQARNYCEEWRGGRLCFEGEWERAARGGCDLYTGDCQNETPKYPWGNDPVSCTYVEMLGLDGGFGCGTDQTKAVGSKPAGDSPYGIKDMVGSVQEWIWDYYSTYNAGTTAFPKGPIVGTQRMWKGGAFTQEAKLQRPSSRFVYTNPTINHAFGIRCCRRTGALLPVDTAASHVYVSPPPDPTLTQLLSATQAPADDTTWTLVRVFLKDIEGQPLQGMTIEVQATGEGHTVEYLKRRSDPQGFAEARIKSSRVELKTISVLASAKGDSPYTIDDMPTIDFRACGVLGTGCPPSWTCVSGTCRDPSSRKVYVPYGPYYMGCAGSDPSCQGDAPKHRVVTNAFQIDRTEVTAADFAACVNAGGCTPPAVACTTNLTCTPADPGGGPGPSCTAPCSTAPYVTYSNAAKSAHPVNHVTWNDAQQYCAWKGARLCTEAEWEKAARGDCIQNASCATSLRPYSWGSTAPTCSLSNTTGCVNATTASGTQASGVSPYGALEMSGNVFEWVSDFYASDYYSVSSVLNPTGPTAGTERVLRGGAFDHNMCFATGYARAHAAATHNAPSVGFRCCIDSTWWKVGAPWISYEGE